MTDSEKEQILEMIEERARRAQRADWSALTPQEVATEVADEFRVMASRIRLKQYAPGDV